MQCVVKCKSSWVLNTRGTYSHHYGVKGHKSREFNLLRHSGNFAYHHLVLKLHLSILCGPENKQRLFPYTALTDWFV
jgi:hypothetical protein